VTIPASVIPGPEASAADVMAPGYAAPDVEVPGGIEVRRHDSSISRNFLGNLQHLASLKDRADLVQYGIMLMVEIATLEERVTDLEASVAEEVLIAKQDLIARYEPLMADLEAKIKAHG
jgi:hypothetical protein